MGMGMGSGNASGNGNGSGNGGEGGVEEECSDAMYEWEHADGRRRAHQVELAEVKAEAEAWLLPPPWALFGASLIRPRPGACLLWASLPPPRT